MSPNQAKLKHGQFFFSLFFLSLLSDSMPLSQIGKTCKKKKKKRKEKKAGFSSFHKDVNKVAAAPILHVGWVGVNG